MKLAHTSLLVYMYRHCKSNLSNAFPFRTSIFLSFSAQKNKKEPKIAFPPPLAGGISNATGLPNYPGSRATLPPQRAVGWSIRGRARSSAPGLGAGIGAITVSKVKL